MHADRHGKNPHVDWVCDGRDGRDGRFPATCETITLRPLFVRPFDHFTLMPIRRSEAFAFCNREVSARAIDGQCLLFAAS